MAMPQQPIIKGREEHHLGAASIVAKVFRDRLMAQLDGDTRDRPGTKGYPRPTNSTHWSA